MAYPRPPYPFQPGYPPQRPQLIGPPYRNSNWSRPQVPVRPPPFPQIYCERMCRPKEVIEEKNHAYVLQEVATPIKPLNEIIQVRPNKNNMRPKYAKLCPLSQQQKNELFGMSGNTSITSNNVQNQNCQLINRQTVVFNEPPQIVQNNSVSTNVQNQNHQIINRQATVFKETPQIVQNKSVSTNVQNQNHQLINRQAIVFNETPQIGQNNSASKNVQNQNNLLINSQSTVCNETPQIVHDNSVSDQGSSLQSGCHKQSHSNVQDSVDVSIVHQISSNEKCIAQKCEDQVSKSKADQIQHSEQISQFFQDVIHPEETLTVSHFNKLCSIHKPRYKLGVDLNFPANKQQQTVVDVEPKKFPQSFFVEPNKPQLRSVLSGCKYLNMYKISYWELYSPVPRNFFLGHNDDFSMEIWKFFRNNVIRLEKYRSMIIAIETLFIHVLKSTGYSLQQIRLFPVGSLLSGLAHKESDLEVIIACSELHYTGLEHFKELINKHVYVKDAVIDGENKKIKFTWQSGDKMFAVNISINEFLTLSNSKLNCWYTQCDWRFQPLHFFIRTWAENNNVIGQRGSVLSGECITLMVIFFLQRILVLPVITELFHKDCFDFNPPRVREVNIKLEIFPFISDNKMSLYELVKYFFLFYGQLEFDRLAVCTRLSTPLQRNYCEETNFMFIEEPFSKENVVKKPNTVADYNKILHAIKKASYSMNRAQPLSDILLGI